MTRRYLEPLPYASTRLSGASPAPTTDLAFIFWPEGVRNMGYENRAGPPKYHDTIVIQSDGLKKVLRQYLETFNVSVGQNPEVIFRSRWILI